MNWLGLRGRNQEQATYINLDHMQMFKWADGTLYVHILGKSVPEIFSDPDKALHDKLFDHIDRRMREG